MSVDLPDPFCPTSARISPACIVKSTSFSARCPVKVLKSPVIDRTEWVLISRSFVSLV